MIATEKRWTMIAVILGSGIVFLDSTVVNVALPRIGADLRSELLDTFAAQNFVYYGYLLSLSSLLILAGALNDYYGRRRMFAVGLAGFGVTSLLCGLAPTIESLIAFRILQGAMGALLVPGSLAIITAAFEGEEQGRAFGLWAGASAATTLAGPFLGGLLVGMASWGWRLAFLINAPLVVLGTYALRHVRESRDEDATGQFDWLGAAVVFVAVGGLSFGAIIGQQESWEGVLPWASLAGGALATAAFPVLMARSSHPLVPLDLFRSRNFTVTNISTLLIYGALYVTFAFSVIFFQGTLGYSPAATGLVGIPATLFLALFSSRFGRLAARYGPRAFMAAGPAIMALGLLWFARIPATSEPSFADYFVDLFPGYVLFGVGLMMMVAPLTTALMTSVPAHKSGVASAVNNAISRVGPQLAGALIFVIIATSFYGRVSSEVGMDPSSPELRRLVTPLNAPAEGAPTSLIQAAREASTNAFHLAMFAAAGLLLFGAVTNAMGIRNPTVGRAPGVAARPEPETVPIAEEAPVPEAATAEKPPPCSHGPIPILPPRVAVSDSDLP